MPRSLAAYILTGALVLPSVRAQPGPAPAPLSAEELFRAAPLGEAALSPDGRHLGTIITDENDSKNLIVFDTKDFKVSGLRSSKSFEISTFEWLGNEWMVFNVLRDKLYSWGLYSAEIAHMERFIPLNQFDGTEIVGVPQARGDRVLTWIRQSSRDEGRPGPLVELNARRYMTANDARDGAGVMHTYRPPKLGVVMAYRADQDGNLALCMTWLNGRAHLFHYHPDGGSWSEVNVPPDARWMSVDPDNRFLWIVTYTGGTGFSLRRMNIDSGALDAAVLTDPFYDISTGRLYFSEATHALAGVVYMQRKPVSVWFSRAYATAQATVDQHRPATDNVLTGCDDAERKFLFLLTGPEHPASYELLDLDAKRLNVLADAAPWLKGRALCPVKPVSFNARDGLRLEGYMALPAGASREHPVPLVVLAHGGPWVRDTGEFNPEVQFLASRGYAVLQPNYRGSAGYSPAISRVAAYDYRGMCDDVTDATKAIISTGVIDPRRVAIMGGSFGGYLAVSGVAFESGLYRCAITVCGVFDWERFIKSKSDVARPAEYELLTDEIGLPGRDDKYLERISPLEHADHIHVPVLIAHGTEDNVVDVAQSKRLASELKRRGVPYETFYRAVEGHGFRDYRDRVEFYHRVEAFLAKNLGGATLTPVK
jgi:acetyl esterase/lipase